jgi:hypothetical protein
MDYESEYKALTDAIGILDFAPRPDHISASAFCENARKHLVTRCQNLFDEYFREPDAESAIKQSPRGMDVQDMYGNYMGGLSLKECSLKEWADLNAGIRR